MESNRKGMSEMQVVAIIQARMNSSRLPGKVLKDIAGRPMLMWVVESARRAKTVQQVLVAITDDPSDDALEAVCRQNGVPVYRGSQFDVLDRYYQAARQAGAQVIVRLTADCPLMDPALIDKVADTFFHTGVDFAANRLPPPWHRTFPIGLDIEVCSFAALERAWKEAVLPYEREHVMPYLYDQPERFRIQVVDNKPDYGALRWTVDTPQDLDFVRAVFAALPAGENFTWLDVLDLIQRHPELAEINAGVHHKTVDEVDERGGSVNSQG